MTASAGNNPASFSIGSNSYTKIGRLVFVSCVLGNIDAERNNFVSTNPDNRASIHL